MKKYGLPIFLLSLSFLAILSWCIDPDYFWHVKAGEHIFNEGIPFTDIFSWIGPLHWISHEWLSEIILYIFSWFGNISPFLYIAFFYCLLVFLSYYFNRKSYEKNLVFSYIWQVIGMLIFTFIMTPRPFLISNIFLLITVHLLLSYKKSPSNKIYFLPLISLIWSNIHGGSSNLPYILTIILLFTNVFDFNYGRIENKKNKESITILIWVIVLSIMAICINPHGFDMVLYPYINMADSFMLNTISEWRSPDIKKIGDIIVFILIAVNMIVLLIDTKKIKLFDSLLITSFIYLTLRSIRFAPLLYIVATQIVFDYIKESKQKINYTMNKALLVTGLFIITITSVNLVNEFGDKESILSVSDSLIEQIKIINPKKLYNDYDIGGYLIYKDIKVFIDGRADMYSNYNYKDFYDLTYLEENPNDIIEKYDFDLFIVAKKKPINAYLENAMIKIAEDDNYAIFER